MKRQIHEQTKPEGKNPFRFPWVRLKIPGFIKAGFLCFQITLDQEEVNRNTQKKKKQNKTKRTNEQILFISKHQVSQLLNLTILCKE